VQQSADLPTPVKLDADDIEAVAARVVELLQEQAGGPGRFVDAATLAQTLRVDRDWVYARARQLDAIRLGDGPKARLRFDVQRVRELLSARDGRRPRPAEPVAKQRARPRKSTLPPGVKPVRVRPSR
jgi:hypothetical protein